MDLAVRRMANSTAFIYSDGQMVNLGTLGGTASVARRFNDAGQAVGDSYVSGNLMRHAVLYQDGTLVDLTPGLVGESFALDINASGQIVGSAFPGATSQFAFLYDNGTLLDLNSLLSPDSGWVLTNGGGIDDAGQITGAGFFNGEYHAFLLSPTQVHEPASWALVLLASGAAGAVRRRIARFSRRTCECAPALRT